MTNDSKIVKGVQHRQCSRCKRFKPLEEFYKFERGAFGVTSECKKCSIKRSGEWNRSQPEYHEKQRIYGNNRYKNDLEFRERIKPDSKTRWKANPEYHGEYQWIFREKNLKFIMFQMKISAKFIGGFVLRKLYFQYGYRLVHLY